MKKTIIFYHVLLWACLLLCLSTPISLYAQHKQTTKVAMADRVKLATDIYRPTPTGTYPVILIRTPYQKEGMKSIARYFASKKFAVVVQDVRGKYSSEGKFIPFINEIKDGEATLDWLGQQPWCNGKIGMWGSSYLGYAALRLTSSHHKNLQSIFNVSGWIDGYKVNSPGGAFHQMLIVPWLLNEGQKTRKSVKNMDFETIFRHIPMREVLPDLNFEINKDTKITVAQLNPPFPYHKTNIPIMHVSGWYDFVANATIDAYDHLKTQSQTHQHLLLGPWYHNQFYHENPMLGDYPLKNNAQPSLKGLLDLAIEWFQLTLNGKQNPIKKDKVKYYVLFQDQWKSTTQWPPPGTSEQLFYLETKGMLNTQKNQATKNQSSTFIYNPMQPVPTIAGANFHFFLDYIGVKKQNKLEQRKDVLTFTTQAFSQEKIVAGNIKVRLFVASEGKGTDFTAKLTKVDTKGNSWNLVDGIVRLSTQKLRGKVSQTDIELGNIAFQLKVGEKLRLQVSSSNFPKYNRNPNTGKSPFDAVQFKTVQQRIYHNSQYPSALIIPFLK